MSDPLPSPNPKPDAVVLRRGKPAASGSAAFLRRRVKYHAAVAVDNLHHLATECRYQMY
jgi:hypothetical protein